MELTATPVAALRATLLCRVGLSLRSGWARGVNGSYHFVFDIRLVGPNERWHVIHDISFNIICVIDGWVR